MVVSDTAVIWLEEVYFFVCLFLMNTHDYVFLTDHVILAYKTMVLPALSSVEGCCFLGTSAKQTCLGL